MVKRDEHGRWQVRGTNQKFASKRQAEKVAKALKKKKSSKGWFKK